MANFDEPLDYSGREYDQLDRSGGANELGASSGASFIKTEYWFAMNDLDPDAGSHAWGWSAGRREKQAQAIHNWQPWLKSKGPITAQGKAIVSQNARKPNSMRRQVAGLMAELKAVMRQLKATEAARRRR
jgi:hypothetical protein